MSGDGENLHSGGAEDRVVVGLGDPLRYDESAGPAPLGCGGEPHLATVDWWNRGRTDLLVSSWSSADQRTVKLHRFSGVAEDGSLLFEAGIPVPELNGLSWVCPIPGPSSTRFDLLGIAGEEEGLVHLPNRGTESEPSFPERRRMGIGSDLGLGEGRIVHLRAEDWDGDGRTDLLIGFIDQKGYWPDGDEVPREQQVGLDQRGAHPGYDQKGRWRGQAPQSRLLWMRNNGEPGAPDFSPAVDIEDPSSPIIQKLRSPAFLSMRWGGARTLELLLADASMPVSLFRNFGGQRPPVLMEPRSIRLDREPLRLGDSPCSLVAADLDRDRKPELVFARHDGRVFSIRPGNSADAALPPRPLMQASPLVWMGGGAVVCAADLDADGDVDLVSGDALGRLWITMDIGSPPEHRYALPVELEGGGLPLQFEPAPEGLIHGPAYPRLGHACPAVADWKRNGRPDLLVSGADGEVWFMRNNGAATDPRFDCPEPVWCGGHRLIIPPRVRPAAVFLSSARDASPDLLALDLQGLLCVYPRVELMEVGPPEPLYDRLGRAIRLDGAFSLSGGCALWAGPWTRPDQTDILVGLSRAARFVVPATTGASFASFEDIPTVLLLQNDGRNRFTPRPIHLADGRPLSVGIGGCSPCGVDWTGNGSLDLVIGTDSGEVLHFAREDLRW